MYMRKGFRARDLLHMQKQLRLTSRFGRCGRETSPQATADLGLDVQIGKRAFGYFLSQPLRVQIAPGVFWFCKSGLGLRAEFGPGRKTDEKAN